MVADRLLDNISRGMRWWLGGVIGCVPNQIPRLFNKDEETLFLKVSNKEPSISYHFRGLDDWVDDVSDLQDRFVSETNWEVGYNLCVEVSRDDVFNRTVEVPASEVNQLDDYINRHFSEICPYDPNTVMFQCAIRSANVEAGSVLVDVTFTFKDIIKRCREVRLGGVLPRKGAIYTASDDKRVWLHRWDEKSKAFAVRKTVIAFAILVAVLLPTAALHYVQSQIDAQYIDLLAEQKRIKNDVNEYLALVESAEKLEAEELAIAQVQRRSQAVRMILDGVAETLPNSSWLQKLELNGDDLQISGYGVETAKLPQVMEQSKFFHSVQSSAPIIPDPITGKDRFSIQMKVDFDLVAGPPVAEEQF